MEIKFQIMLSSENKLLILNKFFDWFTHYHYFFGILANLFTETRKNNSMKIGSNEPSISDAYRIVYGIQLYRREFLYLSYCQFFQFHAVLNVVRLWAHSFTLVVFIQLDLLCLPMFDTCVDLLQAMIQKWFYIYFWVCENRTDNHSMLEFWAHFRKL